MANHRRKGGSIDLLMLPSMQGRIQESGGFPHKFISGLLDPLAKVLASSGLRRRGTVSQRFSMRRRNDSSDVQGAGKRNPPSSNTTRLLLSPPISAA